ncbi:MULTISPECIES: ABC transporter permease [unclassified Nocardia]|uniref:ABC transporter permease n=1 Tax=unclassified Nocardia TaxID=2637762 RepID=UPI00364E3D87
MSEVVGSPRRDGAGSEIRRADGRADFARYVGSRLLQAIWVLWAAFTISFVVLYLLPADPVSMAADSAGTGAPVDQAAIAELQARYGLDKPLWDQYVTALGNAVTGDLGRSINTGQPVTEALGDVLPATLGLASLALLFAIVGGTILAFAATYTRRPWLRNTLSALPPLGVSVPTFWTGLLLLQLFSFRLHWFPAFGGTGLRGTLLPALTLALPIGAVLAQVLAAGLEQTWRQPFTDVALAKGASRWWVQRRHIARLASVPAFTIAGVLVGTMLAGSVVVESVFARAGVGRLTQTSVLNQDIPVVQGVVLLSALIFVGVNLAVDLLYPLLDPRITGTRRARGVPVAGTPADAVSVAGKSGESDGSNTDTERSERG